MQGELRDLGTAAYGLVPRARRRGQLVQLVLAGGGVGLAVAILAYLNGTEGFGSGFVLAITTLGLGLGVAWYVRRMAARVRLIVATEGLEYDAGTHRIVATWADVVAIEHVTRGAHIGPALVLRGDHAVGGGWMLRLAGIGEAIEGAGSHAPSMNATIPLSGFIQGELAGSQLAADLRGHIPDLVDAYLAQDGRLTS